MRWPCRITSAGVTRLPKIDERTKVLRQERLAPDVFRLTLNAPRLAAQARPGQFVQLGVPGGVLLRRPLSIADAEGAALTLIYRVVGKGTALLSELPEGAALDCLGALGRGFDLGCQAPLLVGGGMGVAPLLFLAKQLGGKADILMGGRNAQELFWTEVFEGHVADTFVTTDDGSLGIKGFTVDLLPELLAKKAYDRVFVCGPQIMMEGVAKLAASHHVPCQVSLERRMACGIGACLSCTCESKDGGKRKKVCSDGPVFWAQEVF